MTFRFSGLKYLKIIKSNDSECTCAVFVLLILAQRHGLATISINSLKLFYGGYYENSQSVTFCTNLNDISYCNYNLNYCNNKQNLMINSSLTPISMSSYKSLTNNSNIFQSPDDYDSDLSLYCRGEQSCIDIELEMQFVICSGFLSCNSTQMKVFHTRDYLWCTGTASCINTYIPDRLYSYGFGVASLGFESIWNASINDKDINETFIIVPATSFVVFDSSMAVINTVINVEYLSKEIDTSNNNYDSNIQFNLNGYYSLFNVTIKCLNSDSYSPDDSNSMLVIECSNSGPHLFGRIDESCSDLEKNWDMEKCNFLTDKELIDEYDINSFEMMDDIRRLISLSILHSEACDEMVTEDYSHISQDIGYPLFATLGMNNEENRGLICCRGYQSCAFTESIYSDLGNILCSGEQSCYESELIWTGESDTRSANVNSNSNSNSDSNSNSKIITKNDASILCTGDESCFGSIMDAAYYILCSGYQSCDNSLILGANTLYCTKHSCSNALVRQTRTIYLIDNQTDITIYSGYIGDTSIYFRGDHSGYGVSYTCNSGDTCSIYCGRGDTCSNQTTLLYCDGKCTIICEDSAYYDNDDNSKGCIRLVNSVAPSVSPTYYPTDAPVRNKDTLTLAERLDRDISFWFDWVLVCVSTIGIFVIFIGHCSAKSLNKHRNELWEATPIIASLFHANDFFSDMFFCLKLGVFAFANTDDTHLTSKAQNEFFYLFLGCLVCIIIPVVATLLQLYSQIDEWEANAVLQNTRVIRWLEEYITGVYVLAVITGSSFTAISICNCYLLKLNFFSMGLSVYHQNEFQINRFFSIVLLEVE